MMIAVFGAGAVGGYFGGRLAEAGEEVVFIARGEQLAALRDRGLRVRSVAGDFVLEEVAATDDPREVGPVELILVGTKAWQVPAAASAMRPMVGETTVVLPLQNGVEAPDQLAAVLGEQHTLGGLCRILSFLESPGVVRHAGADPVIIFGELNGGESERGRMILQAFGRCKGLEPELSSDVRLELWRKLVFIAAVGGVGAATGAPFGIIRAVPETRRLLRDCMEEVCRVAAALGAPLPREQPDRVLEFIDTLPADGMSSLQRDLAAGRRSELDSQLGAVVRLGGKAGVQTPSCRVLYDVLLPTELRARGEGPA